MPTIRFLQGGIMHIVIARHGGYDYEGNLSSRGRKQMEQLAARLASVSNGAKVVIISSSAPRAVQSAEVLGASLETADGFEEHEVLWSDSGDHRQDNETVSKLILDSRPDDGVLIVVTHFEYAEDLPQVLATQLGWKQVPYFQAIDKGQAWVMDCDAQRISLIG